MESPPETLARIPFTVKEELMISSMARWMRLMGTFMIIGAVGLLFLSVVALAVGGSIIQALMTKVPQLQQSGAPPMIFIYAFAVIFSIIAGIALWQGLLLHKSSDRFELVAITDDADQEHVYSGFQSLRVFFIIESLFIIFNLLNSLLQIPKIFK